MNRRSGKPARSEKAWAAFDDPTMDASLAGSASSLDEALLGVVEEKGIDPRAGTVDVRTPTVDVDVDVDDLTLLAS